ncbi:hypothetical protein [Undibacterium terreum]|uniref:Secreted protein n=1 Tax=Undibacterium terreum TaxID=1224302 RepID=A0A916UGX9_9BURK|nr:hypothetical protein [Undibacterium terreum]GGC71485.1 hypothetical protein GCM10011396_18190 [Undibacterium terreum]
MRSGTKALLTGCVLALAASAVLAGPAAYFRWKSKFNNYTICAQTTPGDGWEILSGPFKDAHCSKPASGQ